MLTAHDAQVLPNAVAPHPVEGGLDLVIVGQEGSRFANRLAADRPFESEAALIEAHTLHSGKLLHSDDLLHCPGLSVARVLVHECPGCSHLLRAEQHGKGQQCLGLCPTFFQCVRCHLLDVPHVLQGRVHRAGRAHNEHAGPAPLQFEDRVGAA